MDPGVIGIALSIISILAVAGLGLWQLSLQRRLTAIEVARRNEEVRASESAEIHVKYERRLKHGKEQPCLVLTNTGKAEATDIYVDPEPFRGAFTATSELPLASLGPHEDAPFDLAITREHRGPLSFTINWTDQTGSRSRHATIKVY